MASAFNGERPNPRLQRTRLRAPLSRKPRPRKRDCDHMTEDGRSLVVISELHLGLGGQVLPYQVVETRGPDHVVSVRYSRYLADGASSWVRHGLYQAFRPNGRLKCEGNFSHGLENGLWRDFHSSGLVAAEGMYSNGQETGRWRFWNELGEAEEAEDFEPQRHHGDAP